MRANVRRPLPIFSKNVCLPIGLCSRQHVLSPTHRDASCAQRSEAGSEAKQDRVFPSGGYRRSDLCYRKEGRARCFARRCHDPGGLRQELVFTGSPGAFIISTFTASSVNMNLSAAFRHDGPGLVFPVVDCLPRRR